MPVVMETTITPMASAPAESIAIAASPLIRVLSLMRSSRNEAEMQTGIAR